MCLNLPSDEKSITAGGLFHTLMIRSQKKSGAHFTNNTTMCSQFLEGIIITIMMMMIIIIIKRQFIRRSSMAISTRAPYNVVCRLSYKTVLANAAKLFRKGG